MKNWIIRNRTVWSIHGVQTNDWCKIELYVIHDNTNIHLDLMTYDRKKLFKMEMFDHLTVCKQMTGV